MSRATNTVLSVVLLLLLSTVSTFALQEQFEVHTTTTTPVACSYSVTTNSIIITNTGDIESAYTLSAQGDASSFTTYSAQSFSLKPGETKTIFEYYAPGSKDGSFSITTTITSAFGLAKTVVQDITTKNCANIHVDVKNPVAQSNPCQVSQFSFIITNTADFTETYDLGMKGLEKYVTLSTPSLTLGSGESKQVDAFINPSCDVYGTEKLTFQAFARTTQFLAEAPVTLDIAQAYNYAVQIPAQVNACNYKQTAIPVTISNNVPFINQFAVKVSGPSFMKQEARAVELNPLGSGTTLLVADKPQNPGIYNVDVTLTSLRGDVTKTGTTQVTVLDCYDSDVNIAQPADILVKGHAQSYPITVKNAGTKNDSYSFLLDAPQWVSATAVKTPVASGESKTFALNVNANETGSFTAAFVAHSEETGQNTTDVIKFKVISQEDAYGLTIKPGYSRVLLGDDYFKVTLENKGVLPATYDLKLNGPTWLKLPANSVTLQPGQKAEIVIPTNAPKTAQLGDYEAELVATVHGETIGFSSKFAVKLRNLTITEELIQNAVRYWIFIVAIAIVLLIAVFIKVFGSKIARSWHNSKIRKAEIAKFKAEQMAIRKAQFEADRKAKQLLKEQMKAQKKGNFWKIVLGVFVVILGLAVVAGIVLAAIGYVPFVNELFKQAAQTPQQKFDSIIKVNATGLEAFGNTVIVRGTEVVIPVIVKNNFNKALRFDVQTSASWIKTDTEQIDLAPGKEEIIKLHIIPNDAVKGLYKVHVSAALEQENKRYNEDITLNIRKQSMLQDLLDYVWYFLGGLVAVIILAFLGRKMKFSRKGKEAKPMPKKVFAPLRRVSIDIPSRK